MRFGFASLPPLLFGAAALLTPLAPDAVAAPPDMAAAPSPVEAFARLPALRDLALSPDGRHLAMLQPREGRYRPVLLTLDDSGRPTRRTQLAPDDSLVDIIDIAWSGNRWLLIAGLGKRPTRSLPDNRLLIFDLETQRLSPALPRPRAGGHSLRARRTSKLRRASVRLIDPLRHQPRQILAVVTEPSAAAPQLRRIDPQSRSSKIVLDDAARHLAFGADIAGTLHLSMTAPRGRPRILFRGAPEADWRSLTPPIDPDAGDRVEGVAENGTALWVVRPAAGRGRTIHRFDPETSSFSEPLAGPTEQDVARLLFAERRERRRLIGYRAEAAFARDIYLDPAWASRQRGIDAKLPASANRIVSSSARGHRHIVRAERSDRPGRFYLLDETAGTLAKLGETYPELAEGSLPRRRAVSFRARDGTAIPAYLTQPKGGKAPFPALLLVHGGPHSRVDAAFRYLPAFLASRGYLVLEPNFRGSSGYGKAWAAAGRGEWGGLMQQDVTDGARWLLEEGLAQAGKLCILGGSYGGYAALMGTIRTPDLYACAVAINAVTDLGRMVRDDRRDWPGAPWTRHVGDQAAGDNRLAAASPVNGAARVRAAVLLVHAEDDLRVPVAHSEAMADAMAAAGGDAALAKLEAGGHPLMTTAARRRLLTAIEDFLADSLRASAVN